MHIFRLMSLSFYSIEMSLSFNSIKTCFPFSNYRDSRWRMARNVTLKWTMAKLNLLSKLLVGKDLNDRNILWNLILFVLSFYVLRNTKQGVFFLRIWLKCSPAVSFLHLMILKNITLLVLYLLNRCTGCLSNLAKKMDIY